MVCEPYCKFISSYILSIFLRRFSYKYLVYVIRHSFACGTEIYVGLVYSVLGHA